MEKVRREILGGRKRGSSVSDMASSYFGSGWSSTSSSYSFFSWFTDESSWYSSGAESYWESCDMCSGEDEPAGGCQINIHNHCCGRGCDVSGLTIMGLMKLTRL